MFLLVLVETFRGKRTKTFTQDDATRNILRKRRRPKGRSLGQRQQAIGAAAGTVKRAQAAAAKSNKHEGVILTNYCRGNNFHILLKLPCWQLFVHSQIIGSQITKLSHCFTLSTNSFNLAKNAPELIPETAVFSSSTSGKSC